MRPLLTLALVTYNQEKFIAQAVQSAFDQTYSPLEIILSDDASTDATYAIMTEMANRYRGPHRVVLNRNEPNIGLARQINQIARLAQGELVIGGAGDDISEPERVEILYKAWNDNGRRATCLHSRVSHIDPEGQPATPPSWEKAAEPTHRIISQEVSPLQYVRDQQPQVLGCTCAWSPALFETFGDLPEDVIHEDNAIVMRSLIQRRAILFIDTPLVQYRVHGGNLFNARGTGQATRQEIELQSRQMSRAFARRAVMYRVFTDDLRTAVLEGMISEEEYRTAYRIAAQREQRFGLQREFMSANLLRKAGLLPRLYFTDLDRAQFGKMALRMLPPAAICAVRKIRNRFRPSSQTNPEESRAQKADAVCE